MAPSSPWQAPTPASCTTSLLCRNLINKLWSLGPAKNEYTPAKEPHGAFVTARANNIAIDSLKKNEGMADGSIIVMEDYTADKNLQGCTVMYKIKGYNPEAGDWFLGQILSP